MKLSLLIQPLTSSQVESELFHSFVETKMIPSLIGNF